MTMITATTTAVLATDLSSFNSPAVEWQLWSRTWSR